MNLDKLRRLDARRTPGNKGRGPDADEANEPSVTKTDYGKPSSTNDGFNFTAEGGFWKSSEDRACRLGLPLSCDSRGLPHGYMQGYTWERAKESLS